MTYPFSGPTGPFFINKSVYSLRDAKGNMARVRMFLDFGASGAGADVDGAVAQMATNIQALSNAAINTVQGGHVTQYGLAQYGTHLTGNSYESVVEKAVMVFSDAAGLLHHFLIPAPKVAIFKADKVTVDPANTNVATFSAFVIATTAHGAFWCSQSDVALQTFEGGYFRAYKLRKRLNVFVLEPDLTASLPAE